MSARVGKMASNNLFVMFNGYCEKFGLYALDLIKALEWNFLSVSITSYFRGAIIFHFIKSSVFINTNYFASLDFLWLRSEIIN